jgi:hypothetical protein
VQDSRRSLSPRLMMASNALGEANVLTGRTCSTSSPSGLIGT